MYQYIFSQYFDAERRADLLIKLLPFAQMAY